MSSQCYVKGSVLFGVLLLSFSLSRAEEAPGEGTFTGYFFVDRWNQGVFDTFFVEPDLVDQFATQPWRPLTVVATEINQPANPGAAMIHKIQRIEPAGDTLLRITLAVDDDTIGFGQDTRLRVVVENTTKHSIELHNRHLLLRTTVHTRGTHPTDDVARDEIYDAFRNDYFDDSDLENRRNPSKRILRATLAEPLLTTGGEIKMRDGRPLLMIEKDGKEKHADLYDEALPTIDAGESQEFVFSIGKGWLINEYELQVSYQLRDEETVPFVFSPPVSFNVINK